MFEVAVKTKKGTNVSRITCSEAQCSIGKAKDNLIVLSGWKVGKKHAMLELNVDGVYIADNGSKAGTLVNNINVDKYGPLSTKDLISLGDYCITVKSLSKKASSADTNTQSSVISSVNENPTRALLNDSSLQKDKVLVKRKLLEEWRSIVHSKLFEITYCSGIFY